MFAAQVDSAAVGSVQDLGQANFSKAVTRHIRPWHIQAHPDLPQEFWTLPAFRGATYSTYIGFLGPHNMFIHGLYSDISYHHILLVLQSSG